MIQNYTIILLLTISLNAFGQSSFNLKGAVVSKSIPVTNVSGVTIKIGTALKLLEYVTNELSWTRAMNEACDLSL